MTPAAGRSPRPLALGAGHWWALVAGLAVVLLFYVLIVALPGWRHTHLRTTRAPQLQRCLGFTAAQLAVPGEYSEERWLTITGLERDSPLATDGVRVDDVPIGYKHGAESGFYGDLEAVIAGHSVELDVVARPDWHRGPDAWRRVRLNGRRMSCN